MQGEAELRMERTFVLIKPDGVQRGFVGKVIQRFEAQGFKLVGAELLMPSKDILTDHYHEHKSKPFFAPLISYMASGPLIALVWEGNEAVNFGRKIIGETDPTISHPGTIRGNFRCDIRFSIVHASDSVAAAMREIALWFPRYMMYHKISCSK